MSKGRKKRAESIEGVLHNEGGAEKFGISNSWLFKMAKERNIPKTVVRGKTLWAGSILIRLLPTNSQATQPKRNGIRLRRSAPSSTCRRKPSIASCRSVESGNEKKNAGYSIHVGSLTKRWGLTRIWNRILYNAGGYGSIQHDTRPDFALHPHSQYSPYIRRQICENRPKGS